MTGRSDPAGFTLLELVIAIVIISALAVIAVPRIGQILEGSKIKADLMSVSALNRATGYYGTNRPAPGGDIFGGTGPDEARIALLVAEGFLEKPVEAQKSGTEFNWHIPTQRWLYSLYAVVDGHLSSYLFRNHHPDEFGNTGNWSVTPEGFYSNHGLLFIPNGQDEYTIVTRAFLDEGTNGGYGILFETTLDDGNRDTGYVLQFDRGYQGIIIRPRTNGSESSPILVVQNGHNPLIPASRRDEWWTREHEITLQVRNVPGQTDRKSVTVYIGGERIIDNFVIESSVAAANNFTGFRSWHQGTTYLEMSIGD